MRFFLNIRLVEIEVDEKRELGCVKCYVGCWVFRLRLVLVWVFGFVGFSIEWLVWLLVFIFDYFVLFYF